MRRRSLLAMGAAGGAAAVLGTGTAAWAAPSGARLAAGPSSGQDDTPDSLRALAAKIGLRLGTALIPQDIETPSYAAIAGSQFSVVTPGNGMKWQIAALPAHHDRGHAVPREDLAVGRRQRILP